MIENILFDLGGVLLNIDMQKTIRAFASLGWKEDEWKSNPPGTRQLFENLETGASTETQFRENLRKVLPGNPSDKEIDAAWNAMLINFLPGIADYLTELKSSYRLYLLSNTNAIHLKRFREIFYLEYGFQMDDLFQQTYYSHEIGFRKPDPMAYLKVMRDASITPDRALFVDDLQANTEAAERLGMVALQITPGTLLQVLPEYLGTER
jgi:putative hydrolase of the HAD superfamily